MAQKDQARRARAQVLNTDGTAEGGPERKGDADEVVRSIQKAIQPMCEGLGRGRDSKKREERESMDGKA